ncbi:MAG: hypothetical protein ABI759_05620 [Candidatus Solibacter sp.]
MPGFPPPSDRLAPRSLADAIAQGPLPLQLALHVAYDLAGELRDLHEQARAYGKLTPHSVALTDAGARLLPQRTYWEKAVPERDIQAFGNVLYQMLHGVPAPSTLTASDIRLPAGQTGPARLQATGTKLALRCLNPRGSRLSMQQVATELRLLSVMQRQEDAHARPPEESPAPHPGVKAPATWTPPIGMLIDTPGAIPLPPPAPISQAEDSAPAVSGGADEDGAVIPVVQLGPTSFGQPKPQPPSVEATRGGPCPKCDAAVVFVSRARSRFEMLLERLKVPIVRCHRCYHRYFMFGSLKIPKDMPFGGDRRFRPHQRHR